MSVEIIFTTIHGSRLYGFDHAGSDKDTFTVTTSRDMKVTHTMSGDNDRVEVGLWRFLELAMSGSHQSVEALFSPFKVWGQGEEASQYRPMIESLRVGGVAEKFERTIRKFSYGDFKQRRHACRLALSINQLRFHGRMNPVLAPHQIDWCQRTAELKNDDLAKYLNVWKEKTDD